MPKRSMQVEPIYAAIGLRVRRLRLGLGVTQGELAESVGLTRTSIVNFEAGNQRCKLHDIEAMADELNSTPRELLKGIWT